MHPEGPPLGDATPPAGHVETGPERGGAEVSGGLEVGSGLVGGSEEPGSEKGKWPWSGDVGKGDVPAASWMARSVTQESSVPEKTREGLETDTVVTDIYHIMEVAGETSLSLSFPSVKA